MTRAKINFALDSIIGLAFVLASLSGVVLLVTPGGYQGGRNTSYGSTILLGHTQWSALHTYTSLVMIAGVLLHLALHWRWILCMVKNSFAAAQKPAVRSSARMPDTAPACDPAL